MTKRERAGTAGRDAESEVTRQIMQHLAGLPLEQARKLVEIAQERSFASGEVIFKEGDAATDLYLLLEGQIYLGATFSRRAGKVVYTSVVPSEFFGWSAVVPPHQETADADAIQSVRALAFPRDKLLALCDQEPVLGYLLMRSLLRTVGGRLRATRQRMLDMLV
jgi:CRP-like cAMP-binding protein